ncbi:virion structural protein [Curvibacter phage PCA1]|nr:virion structural protein [Curvibacter phage PCA1]
MTSPLSLVARKARLGALRDVIDAGGGRMFFYQGSSLPATPETATTDTLLCVLLLAAQSGVIGESGNIATLTLSVPRVGIVLATGVAGWVRLANGDGEGVLDLQVVKVPETAPVVLSDTQLYSGGELQLLSCVIAE